MKTPKILLGASALLLVGAAGYSAGVAQEAMPAPEPGEHHRMLAKYAGSWTSEIDVMGIPSTGTYEIENTFGGFWNVGQYEGEMMGVPFTGMGIDGYDPLEDEVVSVWIDSTTPGISIMRGKYDPATSKSVAKGTMPGPDGTPMEITSTMTYVDDDHMTMEMAMGGMNTMTIKYTRKQ